MLDREPVIRKRDWRPGCTIPIGWIVECVVLVLLVCAVRDMAKNNERIAAAIERLGQQESEDVDVKQGVCER